MDLLTPDPSPAHAPDQRAPRSPASWQADLATAALTGVVTAYLPVQRWPRAGRWAMHGGMGVLTAAATGFFMTRPGLLDDADSASSIPPAPPAFVAVVAALGGLSVAGLSRGGEAADAWMERQLVTRGVRRPRMWLGLAAAGASLAMGAVDRRGAGTAQVPPVPSGDDAEPGAGQPAQTATTLMM